MCAEDCFIYRMYQKNPNVILDANLVYKFGNNECGKRKWSIMNDEEKVNKIKELFENKEWVEDRMKVIGYLDFKKYIIERIHYKRQYQILFNNIKRNSNRHNN